MEETMAAFAPGFLTACRRLYGDYPVMTQASKLLSGLCSPGRYIKAEKRTRVIRLLNCCSPAA